METAQSLIFKSPSPLSRSRSHSPISPEERLALDCEGPPRCLPRALSALSLSTLESIHEEEGSIVEEAAATADREGIMEEGDGNCVGAEDDDQLSFLESIPEACFVEICSYLRKSDLYRLSMVSTTCAAAALDESVWRQLTLRTYPKRGAEEPVDFLWRAEFKALGDAISREKAYMRALSQGAAGCRKGAAPPARLVSTLRYSAHEGRATRQVRMAARAAAAASAKVSVSAAAQLPHLAALDAAALKPHVPARQGSCDWSQLGGIGSGSAEPRIAL
jgi:hypothetical protein